MSIASGGLRGPEARSELLSVRRLRSTEELDPRLQRRFTKGRGESRNSLASVDSGWVAAGRCLHRHVLSHGSPGW